MSNPQQETQMQTVYRAVYKRELENYLNVDNLKKEEYSLNNCLSAYQGKNSIDYQRIASIYPNTQDQDYFLHFFKDFSSAVKYEKALNNSSVLKEDTAIIACQFPASLLQACKGFGIYEKDTTIPIVNNNQGDSTSQSSVFTEFAVPLSQYSPQENLLGQAKTPTEIAPIEPSTTTQVFYDPDCYNSFF